MSAPIGNRPAHRRLGRSRCEAAAPRRSLIELRGELTGESKAALQKAVTSAVEHGVTLLCLDLNRVTFMDSSGLAQLVVTRQRLRDNGVGMQLSNVPSGVAKIMRLTRTDSIFGIANY
jgi:anti-anti-sigma factor